MIKQIVLLTNS